MLADFWQGLGGEFSQCLILPTADLVFEQVQCLLMILDLHLDIGDVEGGPGEFAKVLAYCAMLVIETARQWKASGLGQISETFAGRLVVADHCLGEAFDRLTLRFLLRQLAELDFGGVADRQLMDDRAIGRIELMRCRYAWFGSGRPGRRKRRIARLRDRRKGDGER